MADDKFITCLWFDKGQAREAAEFYARTFPNSQLQQIAAPEFHSTYGSRS